MAQIWKSLRKHLNFYRVHILVFVFTPLLASGIFYASNGNNHISYIDSLFLCVSAMTVCGLATVDLSLLTNWQQAMLFLLMCMGSPVLVSWVMVFIRKYYFAKKFEHIIAAKAEKQAEDLVVAEAEAETRPWPSRFASVFRKNSDLSAVAEDSREESKEHEHSSKNISKKLRTDMIRRVDDAPKLINPSGWISEGDRVQLKKVPTIQPETTRQLAFARTPTISGQPLSADRAPTASPARRKRFTRRLSDPGAPSRPQSLLNYPMQRFETMGVGQVATSANSNRFPRTQTIEFAPSVLRRRERGRSDRNFSRTRSHDWASSSAHNLDSDDRRSTYRSSLVPGVTLTTHGTTHTHRPVLTKHRGFGGFPMPFRIIKKIFRRLFPHAHEKLARTMTIPLTTTITTHREGRAGGGKPVSYISFEAVVGRNSAFHTLTSEQLEELGGVEYRALNALLWIVAGYHIGVQLIAYIIIAPYISTSRWRDAFVFPQLHRDLAPPWFALFQVVSAYTNTGMSLVDQSMVPFQRAYPMIVFMLILILAGNTCFMDPLQNRSTPLSHGRNSPIPSGSSSTMLHISLSIASDLVPCDCCFGSIVRSVDLLSFNQAHYFTNSLTDFFFFMILDIGNAAIDSISFGTRFLAGLLQAIAVRAAGFGIVPLSTLAPAVKFLYVIMMYISVYPIAMSVRSTNVYEQQSLGIFHDPEESDDEDDFQAEGPRVTVWSRYLAMHVRRQLAFDMWWIALAIFLVCIIERAHLEDEANFGWFNIFNVVFELVSAYGTVGLSLGLPLGNYSFSGAFRPLSKLIVCFVMIRGRHRGLPVAIDRAVMVPTEYQKQDEVDEDVLEDDLDDGDQQNATVMPQDSEFLGSTQIYGSPQPMFTSPTVLRSTVEQAGETDDDTESTRQSPQQEKSDEGSGVLLPEHQHAREKTNEITVA
ncbi:hypothetical protein HGRIS_002083 [Hohenbuehelia grisea]|uniref:Potassium transport protein n=1 Tax=Hohenbuehelia grisea TaxID=104357 RepID=A0ABR3JL81_9AGAR